MEIFETLPNEKSKWTGKLNLMNIHIPNTARDQDKTEKPTFREDVLVVSSKAYSRSPPKKMGPDQVTVENLINT